MATAGEYLCGCHPDNKRGYSGDLVDGPFGKQVHSDKRIDEEGFEVCPEHGLRLYGWRSHAPSLPHYIGNGQSMPPTFVSPERKVKIVPLDVVDMRDNRDPLDMAAEREREKTQASNGHA